MRKIALLIGVSEYEPGLNPLPAAVKDVEAMQRVLANPEMGGFTEIAMLKNPQRQEMEDAIYELFSHGQKEDLLLFYFSGHGITDESGRLYLSTRVTRKQNGKLVTPSAVAATFIHESINGSRSQRQVIVLDCCFSGAIAKGLTVKDDGTVDIRTQLGGKGRAILTSSSSTQLSFEQEGSELSIYTRYLVEGIEKGVADKDGDGWISVDELHEYASSKVQEASPAMTPNFFPVEEGYRILLAKSPKDDPKLKYRKEVESRAQQGQGKFSVFVRRMLDSKRDEWGLSLEEGTAIEEEVLQPYREYERKCNEYEQALVEAIKQEYPFRPRVQEDLKEYQQYLGLRDEDIASIEQRVLSSNKAEYERDRQQKEKLLQPEQQIKSQEQDKGQGATVSQPKSSATQTQQFEFKFATITVRSGFLGIGKKTCDINHTSHRAEFFTEDLGNGVLLEMVAIPGGQFLMGSPESELGRYDWESPQHTVTIQPFNMGKYPITQAQWQAVAAFPKIEIDLNPNPSHFKGANKPVEQVSWDDAVEFCARLSQKTEKNYRLPSESEWEYACRAGTTTPFHCGETITTDLANYNGNFTYANGVKGEYREQTTDVGKFLPNGFGLYDMHGNVLEWCQDAWHDNYENAPVDGTVWTKDPGNQARLPRGGSWNGASWNCRSAYRYRHSRDYRDMSVGFRVVSRW
ncbi:sulfatase-modifying factor protein [Scytonema hofmannii PCC 7110]|uniref:Sulfatase-modifying factor protein n=1 Tax=Scytonema hofmannii PCC 7110 TaxID=128403 RepID=A0A139WX81_9CYAN|nr:SUMF1/EgtB/PvdO family nonheme iron enzyme [Scytonema hofmannii]KYC37045.1 sulfatase-modifying factor protein [Scytonema hofmannii PCC 7110]